MSSESVPTPDKIKNLLDDLIARDLIDERVSFGRWLSTRIVADDDRFVIMKEADLAGYLTEQSLANAFVLSDVEWSKDKLLETVAISKVLDNAIQIQSEYAKSAYEGFVAQAAKIGELYTNLAKEAFKPIENAIAKVSAAAAQADYARSTYKGFVVRAAKIGESFAVAEGDLPPTSSAFGDDSQEDKSTDILTMLDTAAESLARSTALLTKAADERGAVVAELAARERRIDRVQGETRALLDALVAGHD